MDIKVLSPEWLAKRKEFFTASWGGKTTGLSIYGNRGHAYAKYHDGEEQPLNAFARKHIARGHAAEPCIINQFVQHIDCVVDNDAPFFTRGCIGATPDALVFIGNDEQAQGPVQGVLEVKCPDVLRSYKWEHHPPVDYIVQLYFQMYAVNVRHGWIAAGAMDGYSVWRFLFNESAWEHFIQPQMDDMERRVAMDTPPPDKQRGKGAARDAFLDAVTSKRYMQTLIRHAQPSDEIVRAIEFAYRIAKW